MDTTAGLHNRGDVDKTRGEYERKARRSIEMIRAAHPDWGEPLMPNPLPPWLASLDFGVGQSGEGWLATELFTRFLFSALIDADRLDTEQNEKGGRMSMTARAWKAFEPERLLQTLEAELKSRAAAARREGRASESVIAVREEVARLCHERAQSAPGLFSLTVPTGGGKTLASMLFALAHAKHHNAGSPSAIPFRRIIIVIPYLSIIQQTAKELKGIFGDDMVLEHHSQAEGAGGLKKEPTDGKVDELTVRRRLSAENWDAPIVVTTSVQFFGSFFSRSASDARKLHNICHSVVVFDEVQTLPPLLLQPLLHVLGELGNQSRPYGCSLVFCTATQPALEKSADLPCGLAQMHAIVPQETARKHFADLARVTYEWPAEGESASWDDIAKKLLSSPMQRGLAIVNTRRAARSLHAAIEKLLGRDADGVFHLSTWMMPEHRNLVLDEVRRRLDNGENLVPPPRCILISTQCIEAGVDVDFPQVFRAYGPYDSIVQAAGRCNRNGRADRGIVTIFEPAESTTPKGLYATAISQTRLLRRMGLAQPDRPESFGDYFRLLYQLSVPDECGIQQARAKLQFKEVDESFQFIEENTVPVLVLDQTVDAKQVPTAARGIYERAESRHAGVGAKHAGYFTREDWRDLQACVINLLKSNLNDLILNDRLIACFNDADSGAYIWRGKYSGGLSGVGVDFEGPLPAEGTVV